LSTAIFETGTSVAVSKSILDPLDIDTFIDLIFVFSVLFCGKSLRGKDAIFDDKYQNDLRRSSGVIQPGGRRAYTGKGTRGTTAALSGIQSLL
jgi:hypothetical protein